MMTAASTTIDPAPPLASRWYLFFNTSVTQPSSVESPETMEVRWILLRKVTPLIVMGENNFSYFTLFPPWWHHFPVKVGGFFSMKEVNPSSASSERATRSYSRISIRRASARGNSIPS